MAWFVGQSSVFIAAAFLLGILVGWLIWGGWFRPAKTAVLAIAEPVVTAEPVAVMAETAVAAEPAPVVATAANPEPLTAPSARPRPEPLTVAEPKPLPAAALEPEPDQLPKSDSGVVVERDSAAELELGPDQLPKPDSDVVVEWDPEPAASLVPELVAVAGGARGSGLEKVVATEDATDDLERIEGIGPKMGEALRHAGMRTYGQLAAADEWTLREAIEARGLKFAPSLVTWARQAQLLADGDEAGFEDLTRRLVAGRDEGRE